VPQIGSVRVGNKEYPLFRGKKGGIWLKAGEGVLVRIDRELVKQLSDVLDREEKQSQQSRPAKATIPKEFEERILGLEGEVHTMKEHLASIEATLQRIASQLAGGGNKPNTSGIPARG